MTTTTVINWVRVRAGIRKYLARLRIEKDDKEDIEQDAMLRAWKSRDGYRGDSDPTGHEVWGFSIARNAHMTAITKEMRIPYMYDVDELHGEDGLHSATYTPEDEHCVEEAKLLADYLLSVMSKLRISMLVDRYMLGMEYEAIASKRCVPIGTVRSNIFRARAPLHKRVASIGVELGIDTAKKVLAKTLELLKETHGL